MKCTNLIVLLFISAPAALHAQQIRSATWSTDKFLLRYRTMVEPARPSGQAIHIGGGGADDANTNHRILKDSDQQKFFGYDLQVDALGAGRFQLNFKPLTVTAVTRKFFGLDGWSEIPLHSMPTAMQANDGETVAMDLMVNPATGEKIVEYITISAPPASNGSARDVKMGDIHMVLASPQLQVNGASMDWNQGDAHGAASGSILWLYVPDRGRFLLSFTPRLDQGFRRAGEAKGAQLKFAWNGETFELKSAANILPAEGAWNVYVYQDQAYRPNYPPTLYGASDKLDSLVRR